MLMVICTHTYAKCMPTKRGEENEKNISNNCYSLFAFPLKLIFISSQE